MEKEQDLEEMTDENEIEEDEEMTYEDYVKECEEIRRTNEELLELFEKDLDGLKEKTIGRHLSNVYFYINEFLLYEDAHPIQDGTWMISDYLGDFFIRKCMWSTPGNIKTTAARIKKFYKSMLDHGKIDKEDYSELCETIRDEMEQWQALCEQYNDPDEDNPFMPFGMFW